ncbi:MAG: radical SAM protein [Desulfomonile tiedjei]|nr:radical SAM protein [Desulfomonile tiedjei]
MRLGRTKLDLATAMTVIENFTGPFLDYHVRRKVRPVLAGYKITHRCNLRCLHCPYWNRSGTEANFERVLATLRRMKELGVRILILEGGEPLLWRDGEKTISHVVDAARQLFSSVCVTTNGTLPWRNLELDRVWVSLDGPAVVHDTIRGHDIFDRVWRNLHEEGRGRAFVSTTVNTLNLVSIPELVVMLRGVVEGVTIQFHYPYQGLPDPLFVSPVERTPILDELIRLKRQGYPVANSVSSLNELKQERWTCEDRLLANAEPDGSITQGCYLKNRGAAECSQCGFTAHNEMSLAFKGRMEAIRTGVRIFFGGVRDSAGR